MNTETDITNSKESFEVKNVNKTNSNNDIQNNGGKGKKGRSRKKLPLWKVILGLVLLLVAAYFILVNFLVAAALEPAFMQKLTLFNTITEMCLEQQVHTDDIAQNIANSQDAYEQWLEDTPFITETITSSDGLKLVGTRINAPASSHLWCLMLHGYTGWKEAMYSYARLYYKQGFNCLVPDLRAQGESEGKFIGMGWLDHYDCMLWVEKILEIDPEAEIVVHGQSMGASTAIMMTGEADLSDHVKAVVSDCAYTDAKSMFSFKLKEWFHLPSFPIIDTTIQILKIRAGYDLNDCSAINAARKSSTPTIFFHGDQDKMIPVEDAYELYDAEKADKQLVIIPGAGHAQSNPKDPATYNSSMFSFIAKYLDGFDYE